MRKVVPLVIAIAVVTFAACRGLFWKSAPVPTPTQPTKVASTDHPPAKPVHSDTSTPVVPRPSDPAVAAVMDEMLTAWAKVPAVFAAVETSMPNAAGHKGKTLGNGKYWLQKKDGKVLIHFDLRNKLIIKQEDTATLTTGEILITTIDGEHLYSFVNQPGHKEAVKKKLDYNDVLQIAGPYLFRDLVSNNKLTLLPEEMRDNHATKVMKAVPNDGSWETIHYFDKATGIRLEMTELDAQGQTTLQIKLSEIDTNPTIGEDQFKYMAIEGVTLEDKSNSP
jgi:outer membrane lipoprotein-sorting protein